MLSVYTTRETANLYIRVRLNYDPYKLGRVEHIDTIAGLSDNKSYEVH